MKKLQLAQQGFTIVELLITIVIVAILASVSVTAYSGIQQRGRDAQRVSDMNAIVKALEMYKIQTGNYPPTGTTNVLGGWEASSVNPDQFLNTLRTSGVASKVPVDPINNGAGTSGFLYRYYRYPGGTNGCDAARGDFYVLVVGKIESATGQLSSSPGFQCPGGRSWSTEGGWVTGGYTK